jgi:biotin operon repressor
MTASVDQIQATLTLVFPFLLSLFCEVAAIVGFAMGLGHRLVQLPRSETMAITWKAPRSTDEELVLQALRKAGRPLSNEELADALSCTPGEASKRRQVCEASGVIRTRREGKYLLIEPAV